MADGSWNCAVKSNQLERNVHFKIIAVAFKTLILARFSGVDRQRQTRFCVVDA